MDKNEPVAPVPTGTVSSEELAQSSEPQKQRCLMFIIESLSVGGAEQMVIDLANEFVSRGDVVHVVCLSEMGVLAGRLSPDIYTYALGKKRGVDLGLPMKIRTLVRKHAVDVVNSHLWTANLWVRIALVKSGVPVVVTEHNRDVWKQFHNRAIDRVLAHATTRMITVSQDTANFYKINVGISESLINVVNNGVDTAKYAKGDGRELRATLADENEFLIGTVGRLAIAKNHPRLIEAAGLLRESGVVARVVIAGEGPERATSEAKIAELNLENTVTLLGERDDIPDLLNALDVFVLSSDREGHPLSALEAQAAGTPVVLTDAGGSADALSQSGDQYGGVLVERSAVAIADCLRELAADPDRLKAMSQFAKTHASEHFDKSLMIERYSAIFDAVR